MKNASTGKDTPKDLTDWARVLAMKDEDIWHDEDSPKTTEADWEGAMLKQSRTIIGYIPRSDDRRRETGVRKASDDFVAA
jgi:hypothetical protein